MTIAIPPTNPALTPKDHRILAGIARLTPRQREAALIYAQGYTNAEVARRMGILEQTAKNHITTAFSSLGITHSSGINPGKRLCYLVGRFMREVDGNNQ